MTIVEYHGGRIDRRYLDKRSKSEIIQNTLDPEAEPFLGELDAMIEALIPLVQKDPT